jgi:hypothetical protein
MTKRMLVSALALFAAGCATELPQTPPAGKAAQVAAPEFQVGNQWRYAVHDGFTRLPRGTIDYRVSAVQGDTVTVDVRTNGLESTEIYTRDGNWLKHPAPNLHMLSYSPAYPAYAFPLTPGKAWNARVMATDPATGQRIPVTVQARVLGWDRIKVPAGEFDAIKLQRNVFVDYWVPNVRGPNVAREFEWYVPTLKQAARRETSGKYLTYLAGNPGAGFVLARGGRSDGGGPRYVDDDWTVHELVSHAVR